MLEVLHERLLQVIDRPIASFQWIFICSLKNTRSAKHTKGAGLLLDETPRTVNCLERASSGAGSLFPPTVARVRVVPAKGKNRYEGLEYVSPALNERSDYLADVIRFHDARCAHSPTVSKHSPISLQHKRQRAVVVAYCTSWRAGLR